MMSFKKLFTSSLTFVYFALFLFIIGFFVFNKTFYLSLIGDEWQAMWIVKNSQVTTGQWDLNVNQLKYEGYRIGALMMYFLTEYFGYDGKAVYIFSFITRFAATLTLFYFLRKRECSNKVAFLGSLFFLVTPIGLQATDWVKNSTSYISIVFFLLCINSTYNLKSWKSILFFLLTFSLSIYVNAIRSHGIILTTSFLLILQYFFNHSRNKKNIVISLFCSLAIVFLFSKMSVFGGITIGQQLTIASKQFFNNILLVEKLFGSIGTVLLPQPSFFYIVLLLITLLLWKRYLLTKRYLLLALCLYALTIPIFLSKFLSISNEKMMAIIGVYFTLFMISTFIIELISKRVSEALNTILPFLLIFCFLIAPWLVRTLALDPTHRYFIYSALSLPIIVAFSLKQNVSLDSRKELFPFFKLSLISFYTTLFFLLIIYLSLKSEINKLYIRHNQNTAKIIWQQIASYFDNYDFKSRRAVFYFEGDGSNEDVIHDIVTFGFGYHIGYIYSIWVYDIVNEMYKLPIAVDSLTDFKSLIKDGKAIKKYLGKDTNTYIFPKEDAFYFKIDGLRVKRVENY